MGGIAKDRQLTYQGLKKQDLPEGIRVLLEEARAVSLRLKAEAKKLGVEREFTLDGRFLGDVGELIAKHYFCVSLHKKQKRGQDGSHELGCVEVKLRSNSDLIEFHPTENPELLLVIYLCPMTFKWAVVCNGPGGDLLSGAALNTKGTKRSIFLTDLIEAQKQLSPGSKSIPQVHVH